MQDCAGIILIRQNEPKPPLKEGTKSNLIDVNPALPEKGSLPVLLAVTKPKEGGLTFL